MKTNQLQEWIFKGGKEDQWWTCLDNVTEESPLTLNEIEKLIVSGDYARVQVLHISQSEMSNPPWVDVEVTAQPSTQPLGIKTPTHPTSALPTSLRNSDETLGIIILLLPLLSSLLIWFWVGNMNMFQNPGSTLSFLMFGTVIATSVLIGIEAAKIGAGTHLDEKGRRKTGPVGWALFTLLLWIVGFPAYLGYRSRYGAKNMLIGGIAITLLFIISALAMSAIIDDRVNEIQKGLQDINDSFRY